MPMTIPCWLTVALSQFPILSVSITSDLLRAFFVCLCLLFIILLQCQYFTSLDTILRNVFVFFYLSQQNQLVQHNPKIGVIASSSDLALQSVQVHQAGNYSCVASNVEGDGESNTLELKVMCTYSLCSTI